MGNAETPQQTGPNSQICIFACSHEPNQNARTIQFDDFNAGGGVSPPPIIPLVIHDVGVKKDVDTYGVIDFVGGQMKISLPDTKWVAQLFDASGKIVAIQKGTGSSSLKIGSAKNSVGIYILRIKTPTTQFHKKMSVVR